MYLNRLNDEQKELFLDLCIHAAKGNEIVDENERETIKQYCAEMRIDERFQTTYSNEAILKKLSDISTKQEMRIVYIEIVALVLSDGILDKQEKGFIEELEKAAQVTEDERNQIIDLLNQLYMAYKEVDAFIIS